MSPTSTAPGLPRPPRSLHPLRTRQALCRSILAMSLFAIPGAFAQVIPTLSLNPLQQVRTLLDQGQFSAAESRLRSLIAQSPDDPEPRFLLGTALFCQGRAADSLAAFTDAAKFRNPSANELTIVASDYVLLKDFTDAQRWLLLATRTTPSDANAWYLLGRTDYNLDRADDAREAFLTSLRLDPSQVKARYNLGLTYERLRQPQEAITAYRQAIALQAANPHKDSQPYLDLGILLLAQEHPADALEPLSTAVQLSASNPFAHQQLALCLEKLGRYEEAAAEMLLCARLAPNSQAPAFFLGRIYHRLGREPEAKEQFARAQTLAGTQSAIDVPNLERAAP